LASSDVVETIFTRSAPNGLRSAPRLRKLPRNGQQRGSILWPILLPDWTRSRRAIHATFASETVRTQNASTTLLNMSFGLNAHADLRGDLEITHVRNAEQQSSSGYGRFSTPLCSKGAPFNALLVTYVRNVTQYVN